MRMSKPGRIMIVALMGATATACGDMTGPPADRTIDVATPALNPAQAAHVAITLDDALTRLLPDDAEWAPLRSGVQELAGALNTGDALALRRRIEIVRRALEAHPLDSADTNALELMLVWVEDAVTRAAAGN